MKLLFITFLITSLVFLGKAQQPNSVKDNITSVLPVPPEAASLGKFIETPVSNHTGVPSTSIQFHNIKKGDIDLDISIKYHSGGNRVEEIASRVGLGWALNAGGTIIRSVRGLPDDIYLQDKLQRYLNKQMTDTERIDYLYHVSGGRSDSEPDIYYLSINDINAKIFKGNNGEWVTMPRNQNIKIEENIDGYHWIITDGKGVCYKFKDRELTNNQSTMSSGDYSAFNTWLLTEIEDSKGNKVNFFYDSASSTFITKNNETVSIPTGPSPYCTKNIGYDYSITGVIGLRLKSIKYADGEIKFISALESRLDLSGEKSLEKVEIYDNQGFIKRYHLFSSYFLNNTTGKNVPNIYNAEDAYRLRLDSLQEESAFTHLEPYRFTYHNDMGLPYRNANSVDHWGYANGQNNYGTAVQYREFFLLKGAIKRPNWNYAKETLLKKIEYPTGGTAEFEYEGNVYEGQMMVDDVEPVEIAALSGHNLAAGATYDGLNFLFEQTFEVTAEEYGLGLTEILPFVPELEGLSPSCSCSLTFTLVQPDNSEIYIQPYALSPFFISQKGQYKLKAQIQMEFEGNPFVFFAISLRAKKITNELTDVAGPGIRIKKIKRTSSPGNILEKHYNYVNPATGLSSGQLGSFPDYTREITYADGVGQVQSCAFVIYSSTSNYPLINTQGSFTGYTMVTVLDDLNGEMGKSTYRYTYERGVSSGLPFPPYTHADWKSGLLTEEANFKKEANGYQLVKRRSLAYSIPPQSVYITQGIKVGQQVSWTNTSPEKIVSGLVVAPYQLRSDAFLLTSDTLVTKDNGIEVKTITKYEYSDRNYQPSFVSTVNSKNKELIRRNYYPSDYTQNAGNSALLTSMINRNMVNMPIEVVNTELDGTNEKYISSVVYEYANRPLSLYGGQQIYLKTIYEGNPELYSAAGRYNFTTIPDYYFERFQNVLVNDYGSPLQTRTNGLQNVSYIWSYNDQFPIAELKNVDYATIIGIIGQNQLTNFGKNDRPDKTTVDSFLAPLKLSLPLHHISSYVYDPLKGISSSTDAKGMTMFYSYDSFMRLKNIKNQFGDIIKAFEYHYAH